MVLMLQRPLQRGNFFLRGRDARTIGAVQRTKQHSFLYFQFLYFLGQLSNVTGKVMQFGYLIERRFLFLRKQIFPFLTFLLDLLYQARIAFVLLLMLQNFWPTGFFHTNQFPGPTSEITFF